MEGKTGLISDFGYSISNLFKCGMWNVLNLPKYQHSENSLILKIRVQTNAPMTNDTMTND
jgi:hypothetical protein